MAQYYWSTEQGIIFHTSIGDERVDPFFDSVEAAEEFLERRADTKGREKYRNATLRESGGQKVKEATAVLTSQSGLGQFATGD